MRFYISLAILILMAFFLIIYLTPANAHDWYDAKCCSGIDCAEVPNGTVEEKSDGIHVKGHGILSYTDSRLNWSRDDQDHLCVSKSSGKLLCVYRKPKGY